MDDDWSVMEEMDEDEFLRMREFWVKKSRQEMEEDCRQHTGASGKLSAVDCGIVLYGIAIAVAVYLSH